MAKKLNYDSKQLLNFKFSPKAKGYDPLEVDQVFDKIIKDYESLIESINEITKRNESQDKKYNDLKKEHEQLLLDYASLKKQFDILKKQSGVTDDNYRLLSKVAAYEKVLHRKGIDLKKALSDPDNC